MELPETGSEQQTEGNRMLMLWGFEYHTGPNPIADQSMVLFLDFFYASDEAEARQKLEEIKPKIRQHLLEGGWSGEIWEEKLSTNPHGFNTGKRYLEGKIEIDANGNPTPDPIRDR